MTELSAEMEVSERAYNAAWDVVEEHEIPENTKERTMALVLGLYRALVIVVSCMSSERNRTMIITTLRATFEADVQRLVNSKGEHQHDVHN